VLAGSQGHGDAGRRHEQTVDVRGEPLVISRRPRSEGGSSMVADLAGQDAAEQSDGAEQGYCQGQWEMPPDGPEGLHALLAARLEAVLFVAGEPVPTSTLADILGERPSDIESAADRLARDLEGRGLTLVRAAGALQLTTAPLAAADITRFLHSEEAITLSGAAMETLALIAYRQPVTRAHIEAVRGVSSDSPLRTLLRLGLVAELERLEQPGRPISYGTTPAFLRLFGLSSIAELPPLPEDPES